MASAPEFSSDPDQIFARASVLLGDDPAQALALAHRLAAAMPGHPAILRLIGAAHRRLGQPVEAEAAEMAAIRAAVHDPELQSAAQALAANELHVAEPLLRARLKADPGDVPAIRMLAELAARIGRLRDAESLLRRAVDLAPAFAPARANLATILHRQNRTPEALEQLDRLIATDPGNLGHSTLRAAALGRVGDYDEAIALYEDVIAKRPDQPKIWMSYGHALKTVGRQADAITAYRRALALDLTMGEVWWSLANLKTVKFDAADVAAMERALTTPGLSKDNRFHLDFALGKAFDDAARIAPAFVHYSAGNALRRSLIGYDPGETTAEVDATIALFTPAFLDEHRGHGCPAADPVFILGMPRAGSTLIEQILSCHSLVEGTMELPDIPQLAAKANAMIGRYPRDLGKLSPADLRVLGESYLETTRIQRREGKRHFIDKLPNNWLHTGFIDLLLPNATIIDARRHPLDCCFSNFRQHFARGQGFSYALDDMGTYYADYVRLMTHFDRVLPRRVIRVIHEELLDDPERQVRSLLDAMGLPFEQACLDFHKSERAVRTASSEQVRRPINRAGQGQWRPYEAWLDPLKDALGEVLTAYPAVPGSISNRA